MIILKEGEIPEEEKENENIFIYTKNEEIASIIEETCKEEGIEFYKRERVKLPLTPSLKREEPTLHFLTLDFLTLEKLVEIIITGIIAETFHVLLNKFLNKLKEKKFSIKQKVINNTVVIIVDSHPEIMIKTPWLLQPFHKEDVEISVEPLLIEENTEQELTVYVKNNTDQPIKDVKLEVKLKSKSLLTETIKEIKPNDLVSLKFTVPKLKSGEYELEINFSSQNVKFEEARKLFVKEKRKKVKKARGSLDDELERLLR